MSPRRFLHRIHKIATGLVPVVILLLAAIGAYWMIAIRPDVVRSHHELPSPLVETVRLSPTNFQASVIGYGTVLAHRRIHVLPQVSGVIIDQSENLVVGGNIRKGEVLLRIDPTDYETNLANAEAALAQAQFNLEIEEGQQIVARREWDLLGSEDDLDRANRELALRVPHITQKRAALTGAESRVKQARADLQRTELRSPFDALVLSESADIGQFVSPQSSVADLVCADEFRVQVTLPMDQLGRIHIPGAPGDHGSRARVYLDAGNGAPATREGEVAGLLPDLDPRGRLARVLVSVADPLKTGDGPGDLPLLLGSYVRVQIDGEVIRDAYVLPRTALRDASRIWIVDEQGRLQWQQVDILDRLPTDIVVRDGLAPGMQVITSALPLAVPGMDVRVLGDEPAGSEAGDTAAVVTAMP